MYGVQEADHPTMLFTERCGWVGELDMNSDRGLERLRHEDGRRAERVGSLGWMVKRSLR